MIIYLPISSTDEDKGSGTSIQREWHTDTLFLHPTAARCHSMETLIKAVKDEKEKLGTALIIECQSSPHEDIALRSDIYIGSDPFHTPLAVLFSAVRHFRSHGYRVKVNEPIAKTTVPKQYFQTDKDVCSMRIEIDPALLYDDPEALQSTISSWLTGYLEKS